MNGARVVIKGRSLDEIAARVRVEHGPRARIVAAERVTSGGIGGFFAKKYIEATVELPERGRRAARAGATDPATPEAQQNFSPTPAQRVGLAALLADAEDAEDAFAAEEATPPAPPEPTLSTRSDAFADLMDDLAFNGVAPEVVAPAPAWEATPSAPVSTAAGSSAATPSAGAARGTADRYAPALLEGPGDLVVVVGERPDTTGIAQAMAEGATGTRAAIRVAGSCADGRFVAITDRRGALEARAAGVELDRSTLVAVGWDATSAEVVAALAPDQIWVAVDAGRKHADTERFVAQVSAVIEADGLAVTGTSSTSTPDTVDALTLPVGWTDA